MCICIYTILYKHVREERGHEAITTHTSTQLQTHTHPHTTHIQTDKHIVDEVERVCVSLHIDICD